MTLNTAQTDFLTQPIAESRVEKDGKGMRHVAAWDIRRHLLRIFGWGGFDIETKRLECITQVESKPDQWTVVYLAEVKLTIKSPHGAILATFEDGATGDARNQRSLGDAHDLAMKSALSGGLKRCAVNLGDQFGLSLYAKGITGAVVGRTLATMTDGDRDDQEIAYGFEIAARFCKTSTDLNEIRDHAEAAGVLDTKWDDETGKLTTLREFIHVRGAMLKLGDQKPGYTSTQTDHELQGIAQ